MGSSPCEYSYYHKELILFHFLTEILKSRSDLVVVGRLRNKFLCFIDSKSILRNKRYKYIFIGGEFRRPSILHRKHKHILMRTPCILFLIMRLEPH